jgi:hypothetical protein
MNFLPGCFPVIAATKTPRRTYIGRVNNTNNLTTYTFTDAAIGVAAADRLVVVVAASTIDDEADRSITTCTIGGNPATSIANAHTAAVFSNNLAVFALPVPAGTTATIVVNHDGTAARCTIDVYAIYGLNSFTAFSSAQNSGTTSANTIATSIDIPHNGVVVAGASMFLPFTTSWSAAVVEDADATIETSAVISTASAAGGGFVSAQSITATMSGSNDRRVIAVATWR